MKFSKTIFLIFSIVLMASYLLGCGVKVPDKGASSNTSATPAAKDDGEKYKIGFVPKLIGFPYFNAMNEGFQQAVKDFDNVEIVYQGATTADVSEQAKTVSSMIDQGVDAVGVSANSTTALNQLVSKAKEKGIMFYTADSTVDSPDNSLFFQPATDEDVGYAMADAIAEGVGGEGDVAILSAVSTATNLNAFIDQMKKRLGEKYPKVKIIDTQYAGEDINASTQKAAKVIAANPKLKGFVGISAANTPGIAEAVKQAGKTGKIAVTGIALPNVIKPYIKSGTVKKAVLWDPVKLGYLTVWGVLQSLEGKQFSAENDVPGIGKVKYDAQKKTLLLGPPLVFDASNIDDYDF